MTKKLFALAVAGVSLLTSLYKVSDGLDLKELFTQNLKISQNHESKSEIYLGAEQCTESLAVECVADVEQTVKDCAKAFDTKGADVIVDIKCAKDLLADKKHCWPCICYEAKHRGWHVIGC